MACIFWLASSKARGFESSNRAVHSAALEDDAFSELGPGESECSTLVTEKLDDFVVWFTHGCIGVSS